MSREDKRMYDRLLEKLRTENPKPEKEPWFKWQDGFAVVGVVLAIAGFRAEDTLTVILCFVASTVLLCASIWSHKKLRPWKRLVMSLAVCVVFTSLSVRGYREAIERRLKLSEDDLIPAGESTPTTRCNPPSGAFLIFAGDGLAYYTGAPPFSFLSTNGVPRFAVEKGAKGLAITTDIFGKDNKVIATIDKNHFTVNSNQVLKWLRPDRSTLSVVDEYKQTVLSVHYINELAVRITGSFIYPEGSFIIRDHQMEIRAGRATFISQGDCFMESGISTGPNGIIVIKH